MTGKKAQDCSWYDVYNIDQFLTPNLVCSLMRAIAQEWELRLRIKEIELDNFKSFGKPTVIPLLNGFTTISGPNGSGKSNIIDSLLFALGLSLTRSMRAERLPDLLNNLSGRNEARVVVRFTNENGVELEISRRIRVKDNGYTSTYTLNGRNSTLSEVHDELTKYNVSPTGFNVIMQGDVTGIVTMSATERRKIIDELAGVAEFDRRIEQARQELEAVGEQIEHQKIIMVEILQRLDVLRTDRDQALKYLELKSEKEAVEKSLVFAKVHDLEKKIACELAELEKLDAKEQTLLEVMEQAERTLLTLKSELSEIEREIREKGGNEQLLLRQNLENTRGELTRQHQGNPLLARQFAQDNDLDLPRQSSVLAHFDRLDLVPEDFSFRPTLRRILREQNFRIEGVAASGEIAFITQPVVPQARF